MTLEAQRKARACQSLRTLEALKTRYGAAAVSLALSRLTPRRGVILRLRLEGWTLEDIGHEFGVSKVRIRQLEQRGLSKLLRILELYSEHKKAA